MCGIFAYVGKQTTAAQIVLSGLKDLEYRGYDSWGVAVIPENRFQIFDATQKWIRVKKRVGQIGNSTVADLPRSSFALGHTRWATHGGVTLTNAHPHLDCSGQIAVVHNGIIENYVELKSKLIKADHTFISATDTEVAVHLIEELTKTFPFTEAVRRAFNQFTGQNALIAFTTHQRQFVAVRQGSPLIIGFGRNENFLASDAAALLPYTRHVYFLEDGELAEVGERGVKLLDVSSNQEKKFTPLKLNWAISAAEKGEFAHFMLKEIFEQPKIISEIAASAPSSASHAAQLLKKAYGSYLVGCGTAAYACMAGSYIFSKVAKYHINWAIGSEFGYHQDFLTPRSLVMALSQSGETMDILESVKRAKLSGARILALVNVLGSSLYRLSHEKILIGAGPEKAVASTKAFTAKIAHLILIAYALNGKLNSGQRVLTKAVTSTRAVLEAKNIHHIRQLAHKLKTARDLFVIGRGLSYPASLETAIKIKEISYIHAEGLAAGELKHGPLALVEKATPCIAFLPTDETYGANLAGAMEMKARGGFIIGISSTPHEVFDYFIPVADAKEATLIPNVIVGQLLAYYLALARHLDPDRPRNLAKSVTVK